MKPSEFVKKNYTIKVNNTRNLSSNIICFYL